MEYKELKELLNKPPKKEPHRFIVGEKTLELFHEYVKKEFDKLIDNLNDK